MASPAKAIVLLTYFLLTVTLALAQIVPYDQANSHVSQTATVEGPVTEVFTSRDGDTFIDVGGRYPNQVFSGVIFADSSATVGTFDNLVGKTIDLTGVIVIYHAKPEIIITSRGQLKIK